MTLPVDPSQHDAPTSDPQGDDAAPGGAHPASPKRRTLPFRRHRIESEEDERRRRIVRNLRLLFGACAFIAFLTMLPPLVGLIQYAFTDSSYLYRSPRVVRSGGSSDQRLPSLEETIATERERIRPAPGAPPHEPGSPHAIREELFASLLKEREEAQRQYRELEREWKVERHIVALWKASILLALVLYYVACLWKVRSYPLLIPVSALGLVLVNFGLVMLGSPETGVLILWVAIPMILLYMIAVGADRVRKSRRAAIRAANPPSACCAESPAAHHAPDAPDAAMSSTGEGSGQVMQDTPPLTASAGEAPVSAKRVGTPGRHRTYHGAEVRCAEHLRNQRIFFGMAGAFSIMLAILFLLVSRPGQSGFSKEVFQYDSDIRSYEWMYRMHSPRVNEEAADRARTLRQTYVDAGEEVPVTLQMQFRGDLYIGAAIVSDEIAAKLKLLASKYRQKRDLAAEEGRRQAFAVAVVLVLFTLFCGVSIWLVKALPLLAPLAAALLYSVGLWEIRSTWTDSYLFALPFLFFAFWFVYRPLLEGILLGIQMRRERRAQRDAQTPASASPAQPHG